jgi:hypothetical protein
LVDSRNAGRVAEKMIERDGFESVRRRLGICASGLRSLRNGTRRWGWKHVEKLARMVGGDGYEG